MPSIDNLPTLATAVNTEKRCHRTTSTRVRVVRREVSQNFAAQRAPAQFFVPGQTNLLSVMGTVADGNHYAPAGTGVLATGAWLHFAAVHAGSQQLLSINGNLVTMDNLGAATAGGPGVLYLGNDGFYAPLNGYMDDVRIYTKALTAKEILRGLLAPVAVGVVITLEYDMARMDGPPFSVTEAELRQ